MYCRQSPSWRQVEAISEHFGRYKSWHVYVWLGCTRDLRWRCMSSIRTFRQFSTFFVIFVPNFPNVSCSFPHTIEWMRTREQIWSLIYSDKKCPKLTKHLDRLHDHLCIESVQHVEIHTKIFPIEIANCNPLQQYSTTTGACEHVRQKRSFDMFPARTCTNLLATWLRQHFFKSKTK